MRLHGKAGADMDANSAPLVTLTRGSIIESMHRGYIAVVDADARVIWSAGDPRHVTYYRSSAKPIQVLPVVASGACDRFGITQRELAVMVGSHHAQSCHVEAVRSILDKIGLDESSLECGIHRPTDSKQAERLAKEGLPVTPIYNNCSGKHAGMLAYALHMGYPVENYVDALHPVQVDMHAAVAEMCGLKPEEVAVGVDGCGVAVFGMPVANMAYAYARLSEPDAMPERFREAGIRVRAAMTDYPVMVGGDKDFSTRLMQARPGEIVAKGGAEGLLCFAMLGRGIGTCVKIEDGNARALPVAVAEVLHQLGLVKASAQDGSSDGGATVSAGQPEVLSTAQPIRNHRRETVGHMQPCFRLQPVNSSLLPARS